MTVGASISIVTEMKRLRTALGDGVHLDIGGSVSAAHSVLALGNVAIVATQSTSTNRSGEECLVLSSCAGCGGASAAELEHVGIFPFKCLRH